MTVDIDEGKKAEEQLEFAAQLQATLNVIPAYAWYAAPSGGLTFVNKRTADYLGLPKDHPLRFGIDVGAQWDAHLPFVHPDDRAETQENWSTRLRTGEGGEGSFRVRNAQGGYRWYTGSAAYNETEIHYWSEEASRIWGFDPAQGIPSREAVWQRIHPDDRDGVNANIEHGVREKRSFANEFRIILPDGTIKHIVATNDPVFSASGELLEIVVTGLDVTERKRAEQTLRESEAKFRDYAETAS